MRHGLLFGSLMACAGFLGLAAAARAQDRPPIGFPTDPKDQAYTCSGQVMLAAFEASEDKAAWSHSEATLMEAGRRWVTDYAARSGQTVDAALQGDVGKVTEAFGTQPRAMRKRTVDWCVRTAP